MSSWFDSVKSFAQNLVGAKTSEKIVSASNIALTILTKPIQSVTGRFEQAKTLTSNQGATSLVVQGATNVVLATSPFNSAIKTAVVGTVSKLSPITKIGLTTGAVVGGGFLVANPNKIPEPSSLPVIGVDIPTEPSYQNGIDYVKNHPYATISFLTAGLIALGFSSVKIASLISTYSLSSALKDNAQATNDNPPTTIQQDTPYKEQIKIIEAQSKAELKLLEEQTKAQKEIIKLTTLPIIPQQITEFNPIPPVVAPGSPGIAPGGKPKKPKKKPKKKAKKKTRRSKKKPKKKSKSIKRRKN